MYSWIESMNGLCDRVASRWFDRDGAGKVLNCVAARRARDWCVSQPEAETSLMAQNEGKASRELRD